MKSKFLQLYVFFNSLDRRYIQLAQFVIMLGMVIALGSPDDGSGSTR